MSAIFKIKRGDTLPTLQATLSVNGVAFDLSTADSVRFRMRPQTSTTVTVDKDASITDAAAGKVDVALTALETAIAGAYEAEFVVKYASGDEYTFPSDGFVPVLVSRDV